MSYKVGEWKLNEFKKAAEEKEIVKRETKMQEEEEIVPQVEAMLALDSVQNDYLDPLNVVMDWAKEDFALHN